MISHLLHNERQRERERRREKETKNAEGWVQKANVFNLLSKPGAHLSKLNLIRTERRRERGRGREGV